MMNVRSVVALSDQDIADFFPGAMWSELEALLPGYCRVRVPLASPGEWIRLWREQPAEILVSAWENPPLNRELAPGELQPLKYLCYLPGTGRKRGPPEVIRRRGRATKWGNSTAATVAECT